MRLSTLLTIMALLFHTGTAFSSSQAFPLHGGFIDCGEICRVLVDAASNCSPPRAPVTNNAIYLNCFCQSDELRGLPDNGELCRPRCKPELSQYMRFSYESLCGDRQDLTTSSSTSSPTPAPRPALTSTSTPSPNSVKAAASSSLTTFTQAAEPTSTSAPVPEVPLPHHSHSPNWIQKSWKYVVAAILVLVTVLALVVAGLYYRRRRLQRSSPEEEPWAELLPALQERLEEEYGPMARGRIIPLKTMNTNSFRGRLSRLPLPDPIINRGQRRRDVSANASRLLAQLPPLNTQGAWTPQRPSSVRTTHTASSVGQRSVSSPLAPITPHSSPLSPISPATLRKTSLGESLRNYKAEQVRQEKAFEEGSRSIGDLRRAAGYPVRQRDL